MVEGMTPRDIVNRIASRWPNYFTGANVTENWVSDYADAMGSMSPEHAKRAYVAMQAGRTRQGPPQPGEFMEFAGKSKPGAQGGLNRKEMAEYCKAETPKLVDQWKKLHADRWKKAVANKMEGDFAGELSKRANLVAQYNFRTGQYQYIVMPEDFEEIVAGRLRARKATRPSRQSIGANLTGAAKQAFNSQKPL